MIFKLFILLFFLINPILCSQNEKIKSKFKPNKIGLLYGYGNERNFIFDDTDYFFNSHSVKVILHFPLSNGSIPLELNLLPQIHFMRHQLKNEFFIFEWEENYEEKRRLFTTLRSLQLIALQFEFRVNRKISNVLNGYAFLAFGPAVIDNESERLSKGFTFIENIGLGLSGKLNKNLFFDLKPNFGHVSNANIKLPNSGYNFLGIEIGLSLKLK